MQVVNLDSTFRPFDKPGYQEIAIDIMNFPSGCEPNVKIYDDLLDVVGPVTITCRIKEIGDMMTVLLATDALKRLGVTDIRLFIPYLPFARQDRVCNHGESFSLKVLADLINSQGYSKVMIYDPHSEVAPSLINKSFVYTNHLFIRKAVSDAFDSTIHPFVIVAPDAGAVKKVYAACESINFPGQIVECSKKRDMSTGMITSYTVHADDLGGKDAYIIDDICDGGATFIQLTKDLKAKGARKVFLFVSFGIFSRGVQHLFSHGIDEIYATDLFKNNDRDEALYLNFTQIKHTELF